MKNPASRIMGGGAAIQTDDTVRVSQVAAIGRTRSARRIRWRHILVHRRKWSRELDRLLQPSDPGRWWQ